MIDENASCVAKGSACHARRYAMRVSQRVMRAVRRQEVWLQWCAEVPCAFARAHAQERRRQFMLVQFAV